MSNANGFSLHAGVNCEGHQKNKRERLCRYIARPAVATPRLSLTSTGKVIYTLKTPYRDWTTHVAFDRGGHPPNHQWRGLVTPAKRGTGVKRISNDEVRSATERHAAKTLAQHLKRVFNIDIEICARCGGAVKVIADASDRCIEGQDIIDKILAHLRDKNPTSSTLPLLSPPSRVPPETLPLFTWKGAR